MEYDGQLISEHGVKRYLKGAAAGQREYNLVQVTPAVAKQEIASLKLSSP